MLYLEQVIAIARGSMHPGAFASWKGRTHPLAAASSHGNFQAVVAQRRLEGYAGYFNRSYRRRYLGME